MKKSQNQLLLEMMIEGRTVTRVTAMHYGIMNLTARIADLRNADHNVKCRMRADMHGNEYGEFYLPEPVAA